jgi:CRISPR system Cascade subunit CasC
MTRTIVDVHVLQTVPPSNINRDDTGSPKTAIYGGVRRARVSSQAWKRAARLAFGDQIEATDLGVRSKRIVELLAEEIRAQAPELGERAMELAGEVFKGIGIKVKAAKKEDPERSDYLVFLSRAQVQNLAHAAVASADEKDVPAALKNADVKALADRGHSIDIALFGRMVADQADLNVDASAQVAHAISVHPVETEFDYFTAVDDRNPEEETGAGMIGTVEFNSATLYRYATLDVDALMRNLGDAEASTRAVRTFVDSFVRSMPTGKQNTFANRTLPEAVVVMVRETQPVNLVGAFERPVRESESSGRVKRAVDALVEEARDVEESYVESPVATWVTRMGEDTAALDGLARKASLPALVEQLAETVRTRIGQQP